MVTLAFFPRPFCWRKPPARYENLIPLMLPVADLVKRSDPEGAVTRSPRGFGPTFSVRLDTPQDQLKLTDLLLKLGPFCKIKGHQFFRKLYWINIFEAKFCLKPPGPDAVDAEGVQEPELEKRQVC